MTRRVRITRRRRPQRVRRTEEQQSLDERDPTPSSEDVERLRSATDALLERIDEALVG